jgi:hypothetical protein
MQPKRHVIPVSLQQKPAQPRPFRSKGLRSYFLERIAIIEKDLRFSIRIRILVPIYRWCDLVSRRRCGLEEEWPRSDIRKCFVVFKIYLPSSPPPPPPPLPKHRPPRASITIPSAQSNSSKPQLEQTKSHIGRKRTYNSKTFCKDSTKTTNAKNITTIPTTSRSLYSLAMCIGCREA